MAVRRTGGSGGLIGPRAFYTATGFVSLDEVGFPTGPLLVPELRHYSGSIAKLKVLFGLLCTSPIWIVGA